MPKNKPQTFKLKQKRANSISALVVESEVRRTPLVANGMHTRHNCIIRGAQGVPSNGVRGWCKTIQDQLAVPMYFYGDLDAYTLQNIFRTLKAGSAASLIRNSDFSAPDVRFSACCRGRQKIRLLCYSVNDRDAVEARSLQESKDALENDPFFQDKKNKTSGRHPALAGQREEALRTAGGVLGRPEGSAHFRKNHPSRRSSRARSSSPVENFDAVAP